MLWTDWYPSKSVTTAVRSSTSKCDCIRRQGLKWEMPLKWRRRDGFYSERCVREKIRTFTACDHVKPHGVWAAASQAEASRETSSARTLILDVQPLELGVYCLLLQICDQNAPKERRELFILAQILVQGHLTPYAWKEHHDIWQKTAIHFTGDGTRREQAKGERTWDLGTHILPVTCLPKLDPCFLGFPAPSRISPQLESSHGRHCTFC